MISIIIPTYNRPIDLIRALNKLNEHLSEDIEVVVVNDASTVTYNIDKEFYNFKFLYIECEENGGASIARNIGVKKSTMEWITFLDDDDYMMESKLSIIKENILLGSEEFYFHRATINMINEGYSYETKVSKSELDMLANKVFFKNIIGGTPTWAMKKELFFHLGGFCEEIKALEDFEFVIRLIKSNSAIKFIDKPLVSCNYYTKRESVSKNVINTKKAFEYIRLVHFNDSKKEIRNDFEANMVYSIGLSHLMSLSRMSSFYFLKAYFKKWNLKHLLICIISLISPRLLINLKRYI